MDRVRHELDAHQDADPYRIQKGLESYDEFTKRYAEMDHVDSVDAADDPFGRFVVRGYSKTEAEMRREFDVWLITPIMDPNRLVDILPHVTITAGAALDYTYHDGFNGRFPVIYARRTNTAPFASWASFTNSFNGDGGFLEYYFGKHYQRNPDYLDVLETDASPISYFELALLVFVGEDFYCTWHATLNDKVFCTSDAFEAWVESVRKREKQCAGKCGISLRPPDDVIKRIRDLDFRPYVDVSGDAAVVSFVSLDDRAGVERQWWTFSRRPPHRVIDQRSEVLIKGWNHYIY